MSKLKQSTKNGYIASAILSAVGLLFLYTSLSKGVIDLSTFIGTGLSLIGIAGIRSPDFIGQLIHEYVSGRYSSNNIQNNVSQKQINPNKSPQNATNNGDIYNIYNEDRPKKR